MNVNAASALLFLLSKTIFVYACTLLLHFGFLAPSDTQLSLSRSLSPSIVVFFTCIIIKVTISLYFSLSIFIKKRSLSLSSLSSEVLVAVVVVMPLHYSFSLYYILSFAL